MRRWTIRILIAWFAAMPLLWLNVFPPRDSQTEMFLSKFLAPRNVDPLTRVMFFKGWPLSPCEFCPWHGMKWHPEEDPLVHLAIWLDLGLVAVIAFLSVLSVESYILRSTRNE